MDRKIRDFMKGIYGIPDELYKFLFILYFALLIINIFIKSNILSIIELVIIIIMFYRMFSKKIYKRSDENQKFISLKKKILKPFNVIEKNVKDKDHIYRKCHKCKTILKLPLPNDRGFKKAKCPHCGKKRRVFTLRKLKVEINKENNKRFTQL